MMLTKFYFMQE